MDKIFELNCNIDDMTGEEISYAIDMLFDTGAKEVFTIPVQMKKSRPGILLCVYCAEEDKMKIAEAVFRYTTTIGIREKEYNTYTLERSICKIETPYGIVRRKDASGYGVKRSKYEYSDLADIAEKNNLTIAEVRKIADEISGKGLK